LLFDSEDGCKMFLQCYGFHWTAQHYIPQAKVLHYALYSKCTEEKDEKVCKKKGRGVQSERVQDIKDENLCVINCTGNKHTGKCN
jgi:hypothetical protein